eukprot:CAMPEP_0194026616 /NCGR_PEP_ID=MMETSP0009_2-20130614/921_1 /TAXON_ID=210454 /ORGANISM="Grammatophora oceanica, Strain CCMP 410" /LENGTH=330 /DNA_ID=CAMNT_0038665411 /DNA_START=104 /DNA_END=1096 /DNA_ORIENTATION=+
MYPLCLFVLLMLLSPGVALSGLLLKDGEEKDEQGRELRGPSRQPKGSTQGMVVVQSENSFEDTYALLLAALNGAAPITVFKEIDHAAAAADAQIDPGLLPNRLVIFGNPALGTPVMQANAFVGLDLPQKMLVWQDSDDKVFLGYNPPEYLTARYDGIEGVSQLETISNALKNFASQATNVAAGDIQDPRTGQFKKIRRFRGGWFSVESDADFETTWSRLTTAIETAAGPNIALTVDHEENSGGTLNPSRVVVFGNPQLGTPLMQVSPTAGIDLPLKILVTEDETGKVHVTSNKIGFLRVRHYLRGVDDNITAARQAVLNFVSIASGVEFN